MIAEAAAADPRGTADTHMFRYRPDVDGLRALAVVAIILFHFQRDSLANGYLGVDMFFVVSGYLITSIIAAEMAQGRFTLRRFYDRRIRRIGPALLLALGATTVVATFVLLPIDLIGYGKSLLATLYFVSNVYFWRDTDYFSRLAGEKPLLHTWSLGIEEQFYLLFPLLLLFLMRFMPRGARYVIVAVTVASLAANVLADRVGANVPAFYFLPTRAWELGAGASLALFAGAGGGRQSQARHLVGLAGLLAVLVTLAGATWLAVPMLPIAFPLVAGTAMLIWAGTAQPSLAASSPAWLLSRAPIVWIGKLSYSLYLWHWPLAVFATYVLVRDLSWPETLGALVLLLGLSAFSWRFVEQPARNRSISNLKVALRCLAGIVLLTAAGLALVLLNGLPGRIDPAAALANAAVGTNYRCPVRNYLAFGASRGCTLNLASGRPEDADVVLIGNSHAQMYAPMVEDILRGAGQRGLLVPANGCFPTESVNISASCVRIARTNADAVLGLAGVRTVIIAFSWGDEALVDADGNSVAGDRLSILVADLDRTIERFQRAGRRVVLVGPIAIPGWDVASILSRSLNFGREVRLPLFTPQADFDRSFGPVIAHYQSRSDVVFIRPDLVQCAAGRCDFLRQGAPLFADSNHLAQSALPLFHPAFEAGLAAAGIHRRP